MPQIPIDQRVSLALAAQRYIRACERFDSATREFESAADQLRDTAPPLSKFVVDCEYRAWLVEIGQNGDLDAERIERL